MTRALGGLLTSGLLAMLVMPVAAQRRGFVAVNTSVQVPASPRSDSFTYEQHVETGRVDVTYQRSPGMQFDVAAGMLVSRRVGIGVGGSRASATGSAAIEGQVPHPFFDDRHRTVEGGRTDLSRSQAAAHVQLYYETPVTPRVRLRLFGGPSFVTVTQEVVSSIDIDESYPFDTAVFRRASATRARGSGWGVHAGLDLTWMRTRRLGLGALLRYAGTRLDLNAVSGRTVSWDSGVWEAGCGLRVVF